MCVYICIILSHESYLFYKNKSNTYNKKLIKCERTPRHKLRKVTDRIRSRNNLFESQYNIITMLSWYSAIIISQFHFSLKKNNIFLLLPRIGKWAHMNQSKPM